jgi:hypothetical protein
VQRRGGGNTYSVDDKEVEEVGRLVDNDGDDDDDSRSWLCVTKMRTFTDSWPEASATSTRLSKIGAKLPTTSFRRVRKVVNSSPGGTNQKKSQKSIANLDVARPTQSLTTQSSHPSCP